MEYEIYNFISVYTCIFPYTIYVFVFTYLKYSLKYDMEYNAVDDFSSDGPLDQRTGPLIRGQVLDQRTGPRGQVPVYGSYHIITIVGLICYPSSYHNTVVTMLLT